MLGKREKREGEGDADGAGWEERKQRIRKSFSVGVARTLSVPQSLNLEQAHMDSPRGMERKQSEANQFITSAADDLKELDGGWAERKRRLSDSLKVDLEKVHENAPANLERKQSEANLHISSAAEDLKELEAEEASGGKSRARALSISVDKAHSNAPPGLERQPSAANLYMSSTAEDLRMLEEETLLSERKRKLTENLSVDLSSAHKDAPPGLERQASSANLYMASSADDARELDSLLAGNKPRNRSLSIKLVSSQPLDRENSAFARVSSAANLYMASAADDLRALEEHTAAQNAPNGSNTPADRHTSTTSDPNTNTSNGNSASCISTNSSSSFSKAQSASCARSKSIPLAINISQAHLLAPPGLEREASQANLYMASAAEDLRSLEACDEEAEELEGEGGEGPERTAKSARRGKSLATLDVEAAHKGAPPGLERKPSVANLYMASAADDLRDRKSVV